MLPSVMLRGLRDQRRSLLVWGIALAALVGMYAAVYPSVKGDSSFAKLIDEMPKAYRALFTTGSSGPDFTTPSGYLNTELLTFMGPMLVFLYAIGTGAGALAGEEDRRTLDLLLANPVTRRRVLLEKFTLIVTGTAILMAVLWLALLAEGTAAGMDLSLTKTAAALVHLGLLGIEFGALALLVGAASGHVAASRAVPALVAVVAYLVNGLAPLVGWLRPIRKLSPFYQYVGHDPLHNGFSPLALAVAVGSTAVLVGLAVLFFDHRDVRT